MARSAGVGAGEGSGTPPEAAHAFTSASAIANRHMRPPYRDPRRRPTPRRAPLANPPNRATLPAMRVLAVLFVALWMLLPGSAAADTVRQPQPLIQRHTTPNGLEVLVVENHALPLVTIEVAVRNGAMTEPPELNGLSHLWEHMFFKANAVIPSQEAYMARVNELGIQFNGTTGTERVNYFFTTTKEHTG